MRTFTVAQLFDIGMRVFVGSGVPEPVAKQVVESLTLSNLYGVDSHGLVRIRNYFDAIKAGAIVPDAEPEVVRDNGVAVFIAGHKAFGQIVSKRAMRLAVAKAKEHAIGAACFSDVFHIGRLGEYAAQAADEGCIGLVLANGSRPGGLVAPHGARQRVLGTNPIAFGIPAGSRPALVADFSTCTVAEGHVRIALRKGEKIPLGCIIDREGRPTENPADLYDGGALLPIAKHKGYALSLLVEVLGGILSGNDTPIFPEYKYQHNGVFMIAIQPEFFRPIDAYHEAVDFLLTSIKGAKPALDMEGALIPGEPELGRKAEREQKGIPIDDETWTEILNVAAEHNVTIPY